MNYSALVGWIATVLSPVALVGLSLLIPVIRETLGKFLARFVDHHFDERIETLKSELRRSEARFAADLSSNERQLRSLSDVALSLRSSRQAALDARRLLAVEKVWGAKIATDRMRMAAQLVSSLNLEEMFKAADNGDPKIEEFARALEKVIGLDLTKDVAPAAAISEKPFLPPPVWTIFAAYQGVMVDSVLFLKAFAVGSTRYLKRDDRLRPLMIAALPEYKSYIEEHGFAGYYHLLDDLDRKLLTALSEVLEGKDFDDNTLRRSAEIMSSAQQIYSEPKLEIPASLRGPVIPEPPKLGGA